MKGLKKIAGYIGSIDTWMDFETVQYLADKRKDIDFIFVGPVRTDISRFPEKDNIHFLGQRVYDRVPDYCNGFDVCLIPFTASEFADTINPVKLYEYFAMGKPVVAYEMKELAPFRDILYLAKDKDDFLKKIGLALAEDDDSLIERRREVAKENDWIKKSALINDALSAL